MLIPRASPHCEVSANRSGNWHAVDKGFFQPTVITVLTIHFFAAKAVLRSHPGRESSEFLPTEPVSETFHHKSKFCAPTTCSALHYL